MQGITDHQLGKSVKDPLTGLLLPPIKVLPDGSVTWLLSKLQIGTATDSQERLMLDSAVGSWPWHVVQVEYQSSIIGAAEIEILNHFFASEIRWACDSRDATLQQPH